MNNRQVMTELACMTPIVIGLLALVGWGVDHQLLAEMLPAIANLTINTAFCLLLLGIALLARGRRWWPDYLSAGIASLVLSFSTLMLMQNLFAVDFGIDNLFFDSTTYYPNNPHPGRMSPQTLVSFIFSCVALLLTKHAKGIRIAIVANLVTSIVLLLALYGLLMAMIFPSKPIGVVYFSSMSILTAISFLGISHGLWRGLVKRQSRNAIGTERLFVGIRLMFYLSYIKKFMLIGSVFSLSIFFALWYAMEPSQQRVAVLEKELLGLETISVLSTITDRIQQHRGLMNVILTGDHSFATQVEDKAVETDLLFTKANRHFSQHVQYKSQQLYDIWKTIDESWKQLSRKKDVLDSYQSWNSYSEIILKIHHLVERCARTYQLTLDSNVEVHDLAELLTEGVPNILEQVGQVRGWGAGYFARQQKDRTGRDIFLQLDATMDADIDEFKRFISNRLHREKHPRVVTYVDTYFLPALERFDRDTDASLTGTMPTQNATMFFEVGSHAMMHGITLNHLISQTLQASLQSRINAEQTKQYIVESILLVAFLLIIYLFAAFYQSVMITIKALEDKAAQMYRGGMGDELIVENRDELGRVVHSFNMVGEKLSLQHDDLQQAVLNAEQAAVAKSQFLATMSHEIRTPLNGVLGLTELLLESKLDGMQRENLFTVQSCGETLLNILNDILDFSKIEAGLMELKPVAFNPNHVIEHVAKLFSSRVNQDESKLELIAKGVPVLPQLLIGDTDRLHQVMMNLLSNAVKFTDEGEIIIAVEWLDDLEDSVWLRFSVRDTGCGISDECQSQLFEEFTQADGTDTRKHGGTGLGLAIAKRLVELMDGIISVESKVGEGSYFFFDINLKKGSFLADGPHCYQRKYQQWRALIVDDHISNRDMLQEAFDAWGMLNDSVGSGTDAMRQLKEAAASKCPYSLVVIDQQMHEMDGLALARLIEQSDELTELKVIITTSLDTSFDSALCERYGLDGFLRKPLYIDSLFETTLAVLDKRKRIRVEKESKVVVQRSERILLAEDNSVNQQVALGMLKNQGFTCVDVANNGVEAIRKFGENSYDLILMDVQMPELDGHAATVELREVEMLAGDGRHVPIIALTAHAQEEDRQKSFAAGMDDHLAKPLTGKKLKEALQLWLPLGEHAQLDAYEDVEVEPIAETPATHTVIDAEKLRQLRVDMGFGLGMMLDTFVAELPKQVEAIEMAVSGEEADDLRKNAHRLKGSGRSVATINLGEICAELEVIGRSGDIKSAMPLVGKLKHEADQVVAALAEPWLDEIR
ncbi:MAG: response regulator [Mariprofundaceae bacterium]